MIIKCKKVLLMRTLATDVLQFKNCIHNDTIMDELTFAKLLLSLLELTKGQCNRLPQSFTQYSRKVPKKGIYLTCHVIKFVRHYY